MSEDASDNYEGNQEENYESSGPKKNKYETAEVEFIQQEIQLVTRKIEREKIKLRIADERLEAKKKMYNQLQGKPVQKTDEEKEREHKKKLEENKAHKLEIVSKPKEVNKAEEFRLTQRRQWTKINKQESELESLTKTINETNLKIEDLKFEIDNLRKRKVAHDTQLKKLIDKNKELKTYTDELKEINEKGFQNVEEKDVKILSENKEEGIKQNREFQTERNGLEDQYHKIIEANIQRERDRIKEQAKKYIVYIGRVDVSKNCDILFQYYEKYGKEKDNDIDLVVIGKVMMKTAENRHIHYLGFVTEDEKYAALEGAQALIMPSEHESLSLVVLEAMAMGIPIIVNGNSKVLEGHCRKSGAGYSYKNYLSFRDALEDLKRCNRMEISKKGMQYVQNEYSWENTITQYRNLIEV